MQLHPFFTGSHEISASAETLMRQAGMTAAEYMDAAVRDIDQKFGKGYAEKHPELIGAFMKAASVDMAGAIIAQQVRAGLDNIADTLARADDGQGA